MSLCKAFLLSSAVVMSMGSFSASSTAQQSPGPSTTQAETPGQPAIWGNTIEEMRAKINETLKDIEGRIARLGEEMRPGSGPVGDGERLFESQRRLLQLQARQREIQVLQETLNSLNAMARTLESFGAVPQQGAQGQRRSVRERLGWHVVGITIADTSAHAELWSETGGRIRVGKGSLLPDGGEVTDITSDVVRIRMADGSVSSLQKADMAFVGSRIGQLTEEHQAGLRSIGMGGMGGVFGGMMEPSPLPVPFGQGVGMVPGMNPSMGTGGAVPTPPQVRQPPMPPMGMGGPTPPPEMMMSPATPPMGMGVPAQQLR